MSVLVQTLVLGDSGAHPACTSKHTVGDTHFTIYNRNRALYVAVDCQLPYLFKSRNNLRPTPIYLNDKTANQMGAILDLPDEIHLLVLQKLEHADINATNRACQRLRALTEPLLYQTITLRLDEHAPPVSLLLRSLLDRPELCRHVRRLVLCGEGFADDDDFLEEIPRCSVEGLPLEKALKLMEEMMNGSGSFALWTRELEVGSLDAMVTLLVSLLPDLESLHLGPSCTLDNGLLGHFLRAALCNAPPSNTKQSLPSYHKLQTVTVAPRFAEQDIPLWGREVSASYIDYHNSADVLPWFYLPSLRGISVSIDTPVNFHWPTERPPRAAALRSLRLFRLREHAFESLLAAVGSGLIAIDWSWMYQGDLDPEASLPHVNLNVATRALRHSEQSLRQLVISADASPASSDGEYDDPVIAFRGCLNLSALTQLRTLEVPWVFLMGLAPGQRLLDVLPCNLESLVMTQSLMNDEDGVFKWTDASILAAVEAMFASRGRDQVRLNKVHLPIPSYFDCLKDEYMARVDALQVQTKVLFSWGRRTDSSPQDEVDDMGPPDI